MYVNFIHMNDIKKYEDTLKKEFEEIKQELTKLGIQNLNDTSKWELKKPEMDIMNADENESADRNEEYHINSIVLDELSTRYNNISIALEKIENNTYGKCEICDKEIEEDRLNANPAARTCKEHMGQRKVNDNQ